jgi:hypothetical protein
MGYESTLHLIDIKVKRESVPIVRRILKARKGRATKSDLQICLERAVLDTEDFLSFKASEDGYDPYVPDEDGTGI